MGDNFGATNNDNTLDGDDIIEIGNYNALVVV